MQTLDPVSNTLVDVKPEVATTGDSSVPVGPRIPDDFPENIITGLENCKVCNGKGFIARWENTDKKTPAELIPCKCIVKQAQKLKVNPTRTEFFELEEDDSNGIVYAMYGYVESTSSDGSVSSSSNS